MISTKHRHLMPPRRRARAALTGYGWTAIFIIATLAGVLLALACHLMLRGICQI
jgi:hypothetical protein